MEPITSQTKGYVYLLHFSDRLGNPQNPHAMAQHYIGFALDPHERLAQHRAGQGAKITAAAVQRGITFEMFCWPAPLGFEKTLKGFKRAPCFCPICARAAGRRPRPVIVPEVQLELLLDEPDFPEPPRVSIDWYEANMLRQWRAAQLRTPPEERLAEIDALL